MLPWLPLIVAVAFAEDMAPPPAAPPPASEPPKLVTAPAPPPVVLFPVRAVNLAAGDVAAADALLRDHLGEIGATLLPMDATRLAMGTTADDHALLEACGRLACERWATVDLVRLGDEIYVTAILRDRAGAVLHRVDVTAPDVNALNHSLHRVAEAVVRRVPYSATTGHGYTPVTTSSAPPPGTGTAASRTPVPARPEQPEHESVQGFKFAWWHPLDARFGGALAIAYVGRWEREEDFIELDAGFSLPLSANGPYFNVLYAQVGYNRLLAATEKRAFYAGGGAGPGLIWYDVYGGPGITAYGQGGVMMKRKGLRLYGQVRLAADLYYSLWDEGTYGNLVAGLETGVGF